MVWYGIVCNAMFWNGEWNLPESNGIEVEYSELRRHCHWNDGYNPVNQHNYGKSQFLSSVNQLSLWPFSIANCHTLPDGISINIIYH